QVLTYRGGSRQSRDLLDVHQKRACQLAVSRYTRGEPPGLPNRRQSRHAKCDGCQRRRRNRQLVATNKLPGTIQERIAPREDGPAVQVILEVLLELIHRAVTVTRILSQGHHQYVVQIAG